VEIRAIRQARDIFKPKWVLQPLFRPYICFKGLEDSFTDSNQESTIDLRTLLESADSVQAARSIIIEELVHKISVSRTIPEPDVDHY